MLRKLLLPILLLFAAPASAADIAVLAAGNLRPLLDSVAPAFAAKHGHKLFLTFGPIAATEARIARGEPADLVILPRAQIDSVVDKLRRESVTDILHSAIILIATRDAPRAEIATAEALKRVLLAAPAIAYTDPERGGYSGILFVAAMQRIGLAAVLEAKGKAMASGGAIGTAVAEGSVALGAVQIGDVDLAHTAVQSLGWLPKEAEPGITFTAAVPAVSGNAAAAGALVAYLRSPDGAALIRAAGFQP